MRYLPLLFSFGVVDEGLALDDELEGVVLDDDVLVSDDAGGVPELDDAPVPVEGDMAEELDDVLGVVDVDGGVADDEDDVDGDGVTVGGVVDVVDDSRLQPAIPRTSPVQSTVTNTLFIVNLRGDGMSPAGFSRFGAMRTRTRTRGAVENAE